jgi:hypothetical protein
VARLDLLGQKEVKPEPFEAAVGAAKADDAEIGAAAAVRRTS